MGVCPIYASMMQRLHTFVFFTTLLKPPLCRKDACFVHYTYKQEFITNIISNPFFSSSSIVRRAPLSKLEIRYYNGFNYTQRAADIGMFPNMIRDPYNNSAFWSVAMKPQSIVAAGEVIPSTRMEKATYYYDPVTRDVSFFHTNNLYVLPSVSDSPTRANALSHAHRS